MSRERITAVGESAALLLPKEVLDKLGIAIGDEIELSLIDHVTGQDDLTGPVHTGLRLATVVPTLVVRCAPTKATFSASISSIFLLPQSRSTSRTAVIPAWIMMTKPGHHACVLP